MYPLISIIIPVYNGERYISRCIESILAQVYKNLDIIIIDDGSIDGTALICDTYAKNDNRITVIHKKNEGQSVARNIALDRVKGEYISFVDSDDYVNPYFIEKLYNEIREKDADISICDYSSVDEHEELMREKNNIQFCGMITQHEIWLLSTTNYMFTVALWNKLFKASLWNSLRFKPGFYAEDSFALNEYGKEAKRFSIIQEPLYYYSYRNDSLVHTYNVKQLDSVEAILKRTFYFLDIGEVRLACKALYTTISRLCKAYENLDLKEAKTKKRYTELREMYQFLFRKSFSHPCFSKTYFLCFLYYHSDFLCAKAVSLKKVIS